VRLHVVALAVCALSVPAGVAIATDVPGGSVSGLWNAAGSPYVVQGHITVAAGDTLWIGPGVDVQFDGAYVLEVDGILLAVGDPADSILFTTNTPGTYWSHIEFPESGDTGSTLQYCRIEHSDSGDNVAPYSKYGGGVCVLGYRGVTVAYCTVAFCRGSSGGGINAEGDTGLYECTIRGCSADVPDSRGGGLRLDGDGWVTNCVIEGNIADLDGGGVWMQSFQGAFTGCRVAGNIAARSGGGGLYINSVSSLAEVSSCRIYGNASASRGAGVDIWAYDTPGCTFANNTVVANDGVGLWAGDPESDDMSVVNSIIAFNDGPATALDPTRPADIAFECVCSFANAAGDTLFGTTTTCLYEDPLFCNVELADYTLSSVSPCASSGPCGLVGAMGVGCAQSPVAPASWGRLKALFGR
jgi:hypothetical protein